MGNEIRLGELQHASSTIRPYLQPVSQNNFDFNRSITFDPFSRYIPLRVEARLDDYLMKFLEGWAKERIAPPQNSPVFANNSGLHVDAHAMFNLASFPATTTQVNPQVNALIGGAASAMNSITQGIFSTPAAMSTSRALQVVPAFNQEPMLVWQAVNSGVPWVEILGVKIRNPAIMSTSDISSPNSFAPSEPSVADQILGGVVSGVTALFETIAPLPIVPTPVSLPPPSGFVLTGDIPLFGRDDVIAQMEVWEGPAPPGIVVRPDLPVAVSRATINGDVCLSQLISELEGTPFDSIRFRNISIYQQNYPFDASKALGWHFSASWVIDESCGSLHTVLRKVLDVQEPILTISAGLGTEGGWDRPLELHSFTIEGVFAGISLKPIDGLTLTSIGVRLLGIRALKYLPEPHTTLEYGFSVFGSIDISLPGTVVPLQLDYEVREFAGVLQLSADIPIWQNPLGAQGLNVSRIRKGVVNQTD